jgi:hypothetical protein
VAQIFYVHCPSCGGRFPCHPELWQVDYDLLCPFCQKSFPQEESPLIITMTGEKRPGRAATRDSDSPIRTDRGSGAPRAAADATGGSDGEGAAESM